VGHEPEVGFGDSKRVYGALDLGAVNDLDFKRVEHRGVLLWSRYASFCRLALWGAKSVSQVPPAYALDFHQLRVIDLMAGLETARSKLKRYKLTGDSHLFSVPLAGAWPVKRGGPRNHYPSVNRSSLRQYNLLSMLEGLCPERLELFVRPR
jgi:hypothetical protein